MGAGLASDDVPGRPAPAVSVNIKHQHTSLLQEGQPLPASICPVADSLDSSSAEDDDLIDVIFGHPLVTHSLGRPELFTFFVHGLQSNTDHFS